MARIAIGLRGSLFMRCYSLFLLSLLGIAACDHGKHAVHETTAGRLYAESCALMKLNSHSEAAKSFQEIEKLFPYSSKAAEGRVLSAYCNFMAKNYMDSIREIDIYLRYHASHCLADYAKYLRAVSMYMQIPSFEKDSNVAIKTQRAFLDLVSDHPDSIYRTDCLKKAAVLDDYITAHEMMIARFYQKRKNIVGAINRYLSIIHNHVMTAYVPEALYRCVECFLSLRMNDEVISLKKTIETNYPDSVWCRKVSTICRGSEFGSSSRVSGFPNHRSDSVFP
ncbi:MAG: outer membrane protein assembly factor BamD [Holosporaceae bacterium]|jgi:outer membrane protein assembly factor BamD|nr:outer membrane protein assembly factor BamD [Holosporaceae bacterium]